MATEQINARKLIADLGGVQAIVSGLGSVGVEISPKTVEKWRERGRISMDRWLELVKMVRRTERRALVIDDYLTKAKA